MAAVSFEVGRGEVVGPVGPNGSGETTTVGCVEGLRRPGAGRVDILGIDPSPAATLAPVPFADRRHGPHPPPPDTEVPVRPVPTMPLMVESLAIELLDLQEREPGPADADASTALVQAALDFAWGRIDRPWADELAQRMGEVLPDVYVRVVHGEAPAGDRLDLYAGTARLLCELEEELALSAGAPGRP